MKAYKLAGLLLQNPDLDVWIDDHGYCEGAEPIEKVTVVLAAEAPLDGDAAGDEYRYTDDMDSEEVQEYLDKGYALTEDGTAVSRQIILIS